MSISTAVSDRIITNPPSAGFTDPVKFFAVLIGLSKKYPPIDSRSDLPRRNISVTGGLDAAQVSSAHYRSDASRFNDAMRAWRAARNPLMSSSWANVEIPAYQQIIGMGKAAIPFILAELQSEVNTGEPDDWFSALWAITQENPIPQQSRGKIYEMADAWIKWGKQMGYVDGESMGAAISFTGDIYRSQLTDQKIQLLRIGRW